MSTDRDPVDDLLDRALAVHGRGEPRPGLEGRVLATLRSQPPLPWWRVLLACRPVWATLGVLVTVGSIAGILLLETPRPEGTYRRYPATPPGAPASPAGRKNARPPAPPPP